MFNARILSDLGRLPFVGRLLRAAARLHREGSITTIRSGRAKGLQWRRYRRFVNGYWVGTYEIPLQEAIWGHLAPEQVFYDVGANAGFFSLIAARAVGPAGQVIAFEPLPENAACIEQQFQLNELAHCRVVEAAVGEKTGTARFQCGIDPSMGKLVSEAGPEQAVRAVPTVSLDEFVARENLTPHLVKMDIEGGEVAALRGARRLLHSQTPPKLLIEIHEGCCAPVGELLAEAGYEVFDPGGVRLKSLADGIHVLAIHPAGQSGP